MVIFRKGRSSRKMEPVATPPIGLPHQRPSDQGASLPASTQHSILTWSAGLGCRPPGPPVWSPYPSGGWLLQGGTPPMSVWDAQPGRSPQPRARPPGLAHFSTPPRLRHLWSVLADVGTRPAHPVLSSPPQMRSHAWSGLVPPSPASLSLRRPLREEKGAKHRSAQREPHLAYLPTQGQSVEQRAPGEQGQLCHCGDSQAL